MPIPKRHGGEVIYPACVNCHDLKDRAAMRGDISLWWHTLWPKCTPIERIGIARFIANHMDIMGQLTDRWDAEDEL